MLDDTQEIRTHPAPPQHKRSPLYLLTGLVLGLVLGLVYAWVINPVVYADNLPANLGELDKDFYRSTIAQVYAASGDLQRAVLRLALLADRDPVYTLGAQAQQALGAGNDQEARALALLASSLQGLPQFQASATAILPTTTLPPAIEPAATQPMPAVPTHTLPIPTSTP